MVPLLAEKDFFKEKDPIDPKDLLDVALHAKYVVKEPGETVYS